MRGWPESLLCQERDEIMWSMYTYSLLLLWLSLRSKLAHFLGVLYSLKYIRCSKLCDLSQGAFVNSGQNKIINFLFDPFTP
jgi:hypothetical protein